METPFRRLARTSPTVEVRCTTRGPSSGVDLQAPWGAWPGVTAIAAAHVSGRVATLRGQLCARTRHRSSCIPLCFPLRAALKQPAEGLARQPATTREAVEKVLKITPGRRVEGEARRARRKRHAGTDRAGICTGTRGSSKRRCRAHRWLPFGPSGAWENFRGEGAEPLPLGRPETTKVTPTLSQTAGWFGSPRNQRRHPSGRKDVA